MTQNVAYGRVARGRLRLVCIRLHAQQSSVFFPRIERLSRLIHAWTGSQLCVTVADERRLYMIILEKACEAKCLCDAYTGLLHNMVHVCMGARSNTSASNVR